MQVDSEFERRPQRHVLRRPGQSKEASRAMGQLQVMRTRILEYQRRAEDEVRLLPMGAQHAYV